MIKSSSAGWEDHTSKHNSSLVKPVKWFVAVASHWSRLRDISNLATTRRHLKTFRYSEEAYITSHQAPSYLLNSLFADLQENNSRYSHAPSPLFAPFKIDQHPAPQFPPHPQRQHQQLSSQFSHDTPSTTFCPSGPTSHSISAPHFHPSTKVSQP